MIMFECISSNATAPSRGSPGAAGFDLYAAEEETLFSSERRIISTGVSFAIEPGWYGRIAPRSGLAANYGIEVLGGVIDSYYRGEVKVILLNTGRQSLEIEVGDRIAQIVFEKHYLGDIFEGAGLGVTERGSGGFGSTGR